MDVLFTNLMDGILSIFNEFDRKIWPKWLFRSRSSILGQPPRAPTVGAGVSSAYNRYQRHL